MLVFFTLSVSLCQSNQVLRIKSSNCTYNRDAGTTNFATGFVYKENGKIAGIITALHGVCGCSSISAEDSNGKDYFSLKIIKADIRNDIALLTSNEVLTGFNSGFEFSTLNPSIFSGKSVSMIGYPYGIEINLDTKLARVRESPSSIVQLKKFVKPDIEIALKQRGSPDIYADVINLEMEIVPGCSGAPILSDGKVIGVGNGGLDEGRSHICWAIPVKNIQLTLINNLEPNYSNLSKRDPKNLFILTCDIEGNEQKDPDKDGIKGNEDKCPHDFGPSCTSGCPDSDEDCVPDSEDECPFLKGTKGTKGCPEVQYKVKSGEQFKIRFNSGNDTKSYKDSEHDYLGSFLGGSEYRVIWTGSGYMVSGYNEGKKKDFTQTDKGGNPNTYQLIMWGWSFSFNEERQVIINSDKPGVKKGQVVGMILL